MHKVLIYTAHNTVSSYVQSSAQETDVSVVRLSASQLQHFCALCTTFCVLHHGAQGEVTGFLDFQLYSFTGLQLYTLFMSHVITYFNNYYTIMHNHQM